MNLNAYINYVFKGLGGIVKSNSTIQCPFHGWTFDGETGDCVQTFQKHKKKVDQYNYHDIKEQTKVDGEYLYNCYEGTAIFFRFFFLNTRGI